MHTKPTPDEFAISDAGITHAPTGYGFTPYPGNPSSGTERKGRLGSVLSDGRDYRPHEVKEMAKRLWATYCQNKK